MNYSERSDHCIETNFSISIVPIMPEVVLSYHGFTIGTIHEDGTGEVYSLEELSDLDLIKVKRIMDQAIWYLEDVLQDRYIYEKVRDKYEQSKKSKKQ